MYNFTDTNKASTANNTLPTEALKFNGEWFDRVIPGFKTLSVTGRETMQAEVTNREHTTKHGQRFIRKKYPPRTITVRYQLEATSPATFRTAFNQLNSVLDKSEGKIIFNDEPDMYFIGTRQSMSDTEPGLNCVTGEIVFYCSDPFKYASAYTEVTMNRTTTKLITVDTVVPTPVIIVITPTFNLGSMTLHGVATSTVTGADSAIKINNLQDGQAITIDGEACTVKQGNQNKFSDAEMWEFPTFQPGSNSIVCDTDQCNITFKYRPCYM